MDSHIKNVAEKQSPLVSIVMPVYNSADYVEEAIESILSQTIYDFELLIFDDCSTDSTYDKLQKYDDIRIKIFRQPHNLGFADNLNFALSYAKGKYIARMDSDDISFSNRLERQVSFLENNKEISICSANAIVINELGQIINHRMYHVDASPIVWQLVWTNPIIHPTIIYRNDDFTRSKINFDSQFNPAEDYQLWCKLASVLKIHRMKDLLLNYRQLKSSLYHSNFEKSKFQSYKINTSYLSDFLGIHDIPEVHYKWLAYTFSGEFNFIYTDIKDFIKWQNLVLKLLGNKFKFPKNELKEIFVSQELHLISIIKRIKVSFLRKIILFVRFISFRTLVLTFFQRLNKD